MASFYVTTPIYYVNDVPHLGTAYTTIAADALCRFHALRGEDTRLLTGTDEHGIKIERAASESGKSPKVFTDDVSARFREAWPQLLVEYTDFIRTTEQRHTEWVQELWRKIDANGDLYEGDYEEWYCVGCESFKTEKELLPGNICPIHQKPVERVKEKTFFFRLSRWEKPLLAFYEKNPGFIEPESRRNEVLSFVTGGLRDLSVSRTSFSWGIPVPGRPEHIMYVWFDALANYRSALGEGGAATRFWPSKGGSARAIHLVGKDILRFHAVFWPAFLLSAGYLEEELPSQVFAHGFLTVDGHKMSKSLRNAVDPLKLASDVGPDVLRYHLLRAIAFGQDGDFDHAALIERYNADLGKNLGNLLSRTLGLCTKLTGGKTPGMGPKTPLEEELFAAAGNALAEASAAWGTIAPHRALELTWHVSSLANQYVDRAAPWKSEDAVRTGTILASLLELLRALSVAIWPAMPRKSDAMRAQLGLPPVAPSVGTDLWPQTFEPRAAGQALAPSGPLFQTYDAEGAAALLARIAPPKEAKESKEPTARTDAMPKDPTEAPRPAPDAAPPIAYDQFQAVDLRVGVVTAAERVPKKDKLLKLAVDVGEAAPRTIVAGLALSFAPEALVGRRVVVVANLAPREFGKGLVSHGMLLATGASGALKLATVDPDVPAGARLK